MKKYLPPIVVAVASAITHFIYFGYPAQVVFDETFAGNFLGNYANGTFYFDVHPPLAKIIVYLFGFLTGASYQGNMGAIGDSLLHSIVLLRLVPIVCGFLLPLVVYAISRNIGLSQMSSMTAGFLVAIENSLVVQSRFILFDIMLVLSGFVAVLLYQEYRKRMGKEKPAARRTFLFGSAVFAAAAFSIKWTGLAFPLMIVVFEWLALYRDQTVGSLWKRSLAVARSIIPFIASYVCVGLVMYVGIFAVHFAMLPRPGPGDAFMSQQFQQEGFAAKLADLNVEMYKANAYQMPSHQYQSSWWSWPLMLRPIFYWQGQEGQDEYIYLLGNPFVYWLGTASVATMIGYALWKRKKSERKAALSFILIGFLVNYVPFMFITRAMFLYHYEPALIMSIIAIAWIIDGIYWKKWRIVALIATLILCFSSFIYFSPLTYGLHLTDGQLNARMWLSGWR
ncbi:MAG: phospholipid carrier-dependent glycosyltransferase [Candidatus Pacebacteria bacterium]|nr:phospholipid carrier-dependent glycosyltransferase [Candidatus Paceibacterota bacterium]